VSTIEKSCKIVGLGQNDAHDLEVWSFVVEMIECVALAKMYQFVIIEWHLCCGF